MILGFDVISDLNLQPEDSFNWENKATSLYCIIAGNVSNDLRTLINILSHISKFYQGVFYIPGSLECDDAKDSNQRIKDITRGCKRIKNLAVLYQHVVIIDGVAVLGANGWYGNIEPLDLVSEAYIEVKRHEDIFYLKNSVEKLQTHLDVKKIIIVTNSIPNQNLYFGEIPDFVKNYLSPDIILDVDTENKISNWIFATHKKMVDTKINGINYVNNPKLSTIPYWAKRIEVEI
jgi:hypothetical protein